jgi:transcriptional regulator with XRE-family HTH domain
MDTKKITNEMLATGITQQELADRVPCSQSTINAFASGKRGSRPTLVIGLRLLELHAEICGPKDSLPQNRVVGHAGRQPPKPHNILDTVPDSAVMSPIPTPKA